MTQLHRRQASLLTKINLKIKKVSLHSGIEHEIDLPITLEQLLRFESGEFAQIAFPQLNSTQREFLITGTTPEEWDEIFGSEEDLDAD